MGAGGRATTGAAARAGAAAHRAGAVAYAGLGVVDWPPGGPCRSLDVVPTSVRVVLAGLALFGATAAGCGRHTIGEVTLSEGPKGRALDDEAVAHRGAAAVAVVSTDIGRGLAFVVDPRGYLITNRHVIEDADHIEEVTFPGLDPPRSFAAVRIVYIDPARDLALLKLDVDAPLPSLALATDRPAPTREYVQSADHVLLLSRPDEDAPGGARAGLLAHTGAVRELEVLNPAVGPGAFFGLSQAVRRGQSGGPVLDRYGRVVGVVSWTWRHRVGGYAIPIAEAAQMLVERPPMATDAERARRAEARARGFIRSIGGGDLEAARRMMSPTYSRTIRQRTMKTIAEQIPGEGREAVQQFVAALEDIVDRQPAGAEELPFSQVQDVVLRTGSRGFMEALGVDETLPKEQVISFFFEFAQAYVSSRFFAESDAESAMNAALQRLRTVDAARTFAFAEATTRFTRDDRVAVERVEVVPGAYAPQAVVTLRRPGDGVRMVMQMRLEWGDWYVAELQTLGAPG